MFFFGKKNQEFFMRSAAFSRGMALAENRARMKARKLSEASGFFFSKKTLNSAGFTLLEALVALAIAGIGLAVLLGGTGTGVGGAARASLHARALSIAQSQMASLEGAVVPPAGEAHGDVDGFAWTTRVGPVAQGPAPNTPGGALLSLDVAVRRNGVELAHLSGRRIGPYGGGGE